MAVGNYVEASTPNTKQFVPALVLKEQDASIVEVNMEFSGKPRLQMGS